MDQAIRDTNGAMTTRQVERAIDQLDRLIARAEARSGELDASEFRALLILRQRRIFLRLLLASRRIERKKKVVSLRRWRDGYHAPF